MDAVNKLMDDLIAIPTENLSVKSNKSIANAVSFLESLLVRPGYQHEIYIADAEPYVEGESWYDSSYYEDSEWDYDG